MKILLALGANLPSAWGKPAETLSQAVEALSERIGSSITVSQFFATKAVPEGSGPDFVNAAATLESSLPLRQLLEICHIVEHEASRSRDKRWAPRTLDIDLIAANDVILPNEETQTFWRTLPMGEQISRTPREMIIPHPRVQDRAFVLVPLAEVAPDWRHPILNKTTREMLDDLPAGEIRAVKPLNSL